MVGGVPRAVDEEDCWFACHFGPIDSSFVCLLSVLARIVKTLLRA